jgi:CBS domain-containing protein
MDKTILDVMTSNPITVKRETDLKDAIALLANNKISGLPVVDDENHLIGILSETDLMWQESGVEPPPYIMILDSIIYLQNPSRYEKQIHKALGQTVGDVMSEKPMTITGDKTIKQAAHILHHKDVRRLPVVDDEGKVIGILTQGDIIRAMALE